MSAKRINVKKKKKNSEWKKSECWWNAAYLIFGHGSKGFDNGCQRHFALLCKVSSARERICCAPHESWASIPLK